MTRLQWTETQKARLKILAADPEEHERFFATAADRNQAFQEIEKRYIRSHKKELETFLSEHRMPRLLRLETDLTRVLLAAGFSRVVTPTVIAADALARMGIDKDHDLSKQVFWLDSKHCLRPMLAPGLYRYMVQLGRLKTRPIRFFEIGPCFRKESDGARHNTEFTMLNLVEMGTPMDGRQARLEELARLVAKTAGLEEYRFETEASTVYGNTLDVVTRKGGIEVGSGAMGPHPLDGAWRVTETWVGIGFGLERLIMTGAGESTIGKWGKSTAWIDGIPLGL